MNHTERSTVGIIVNPHAGKDIRRLVSAAGHTSDSVKIGIMRRVAAGALEQGVERIMLSADTHRLGERAVEGLAGDIELIESPQTGSHLDTVAAARALHQHGAGAVIVLGGDGTARDVATGWPDAPLIALSTGTNNVYPSTTDGTSAGVAAALVATGTVALASVGHQSKRVVLDIADTASGRTHHDHALVEAALIDTTFVGARAVSDPASIRWVMACIANPASTGLASIAGRLHPVGRNDAGGVLLHLGPAGRKIRVPLAPGEFTTLGVCEVISLDEGMPVALPGGGVLAYDGERTSPVGPDTTITAAITRSGPRLIDVDAALALAAREHRFDAPTNSRCEHARKDPHGH
ncbi:MAG: NAD(+)/NADH kinase [Ilumatobacter sp.]